MPDSVYKWPQYKFYISIIPIVWYLWAILSTSLLFQYAQYTSDVASTYSEASLKYYNTSAAEINQRTPAQYSAQCDA